MNETPSLRIVLNFISGAEIGFLAKSTIYPTFSLKLYCQSTNLPGVRIGKSFRLFRRCVEVVNEGDLAGGNSALDQ
ncbi:MAG: hypothetical protein L0312_25115, partial [Acidobacteria bacterium]|nr:hypothetical protein [Acidobacteriota bacterium]